MDDQVLAGQLSVGDVVRIDDGGLCGCTFRVIDHGAPHEVWFKQLKRCGKASCDFNAGQTLWLYTDESITKPGNKAMKVVYRKSTCRLVGA